MEESSKPSEDVEAPATEQTEKKEEAEMTNEEGVENK
jgi:hypothetical protein